MGADRSLARTICIPLQRKMVQLDFIFNFSAGNCVENSLVLLPPYSLLLCLDGVDCYMLLRRKQPLYHQCTTPNTKP